MGNFGTVPRGTYGKLYPKPLPVLTPRVQMGPIGEAAVLRRSAEPPPPRSPKDVPNDLSLRNLIPCSRFSASLASFSSRTLSNSACEASFSLFMVSRSALKAATSSDTDINYTLACLLSQPLGAVSAIFSSAVPVPDGHRTSYTSLAVPVPSRSQVHRLSGSQNVYVAPFWPD